MRTSRFVHWSLLLVAAAAPAAGQEHAHGAAAGPRAGEAWAVKAMAQVFPLVTAGEPFHRRAQLNVREAYLTQPALMVNVESPGRRLVLRTTLDFEQWTQPEGEYTFGGWGEGFIDKRHPHTLVHELMLSWNVAGARGGGVLSISAGKGFAPYGTEDPMGRPVSKYPTNHHLSQILERWTVNVAWLHRSGWSIEAGVFGGAEPEHAYDFSNIESFGDSWSARVAKRFGGTARPWEASASYARVREVHGDERETTSLANAALRYSAPVPGVYALVEASRSEAEGGAGYWAVLAESQVRRGRHRPYARVELATRPEFHRNGEPGTAAFFRYDHDTHSDGSTRWLITSVGYGYDADGGDFAARPFIELQHHRVSGGRGDVDPLGLYGRSTLWSVSTGFRIFLGGGPMRMGSYGVLDPMSAPAPSTGPASVPAGTHTGH